MNERIKELAEQAGAEYSDFHSVSLLDKEIEVFAELIIRECCQKLENDGIVEVAMELREHFGVEE
jgi:hypothetical protein